MKKRLYQMTIVENESKICLERTVARTHNKGLKEMAGEVVNQTVVLSTNFCGRLTVPASKPLLL